MTSTDHTIRLGSVSALERALAQEVSAARAQDPLAQVVVLVSGTLLRAHLRRRLAELDEVRHGHLGVHIVTPGELALMLGEHALLDAGRRPLPVLADRLLAAEAARQAGELFGDVRETPGFAAAIHRTLLELRRAGVDPKELAAAAGEALEPQKTATLAQIAARHRELRAELYDADDALEHADGTRLPGDRLLVHGPWEMPGTLRAAIAAVAETHSVHVHLPTGAPSAMGAHAELRGWLSDELGAAEVQLDDDHPDTNLARLRAGLFGGPGSEMIEPDGTVAILSAPDPAREVRAALRQCLAWAAQGIPFREMAIVYRDAGTYRPLVAAAARAANIPTYRHEGTPLHEMPVGRRALALLDIWDGDLSRAAVTAMLADARLPDDTRARCAGSPTLWDRVSREAGVVDAIEQWRTRLPALARGLRDKHGEEPPEWLPHRLAAIEGLGTLVDDLHEHIERRPQRASWSHYVVSFKQLLDHFTVDHEPITEALADLLRLDALTGDTTPERFGRVVRGVLESLRADEGDQGALRARGVAVIDSFNIRHLTFRAVAVLGLAERSFPPPPSQDPLLLDDERERLPWPLSLRARGADPEPLAFSVALDAASERLLISYARTEHGGGRPKLPSSFLRAAVETLAAQRIPAEQLDDQQWVTRLDAGRVGAPTPDEALDPGERERTLLETDPAVARALLLARRPACGHAIAAHTARTTAPDLTPWDGQLSPDVAARLAASDWARRAVPPTALEQFVACPLRSMLARTLGLRALQDPEDLPRLSPMERGSAVHRIIERFFDEHGGDDRPRPERRTAHLKRLNEIAAEELDAVQKAGLTGYAQLWAIDRRELLEDLESWYDMEAGDEQARAFDGLAMEVSVGIDGPWRAPHPMSRAEPFERPLTGGAVLRLSGRIDRLEWRKDGAAFRVLDHKTGGLNAPARSMLKGGALLQRPLYLLVAGWLLDREPAAGASGYRSVSRREEFRTALVEGADLDMSDLDKILDTITSAIAAGTFPARPGAVCQWCDFVSLCPPVKEHAARQAAKTDMRLEPLDALKEIK